MMRASVLQRISLTRIFESTEMSKLLVDLAQLGMDIKHLSAH